MNNDSLEKEICWNPETKTIVGTVTNEPSLNNDYNIVKRDLEGNFLEKYKLEKVDNLNNIFKELYNKNYFNDELVMVSYNNKEEITDVYFQKRDKFDNQFIDNYNLNLDYVTFSDIILLRYNSLGSYIGAYYSSREKINELLNIFYIDNTELIKCVKDHYGYDKIKNIIVQDFGAKKLYITV